MDSEIISSIIWFGICIAFIVIKSVSQNKKKAKLQHIRPISPPPVPPVHHPVRSTPETERAQTDSFSDFNEEGQRVTEDNVMQPIQDNIAKLEAPTRQNLRSAIIWGEILNRKF